MKHSDRTPVRLAEPAGSSFWGRSGLWRFSLASAVATGTDFLVVNLLVSQLGALPWAATALGCIVGAVVNFVVNRLWTFEDHGPPLGQATRYGLVSGAGALLNAGGVGLLTALTPLDYRVVWGLVRAGVFLLWSYPLNRGYVFQGEPRETPIEPSAFEQRSV